MAQRQADLWQPSNGGKRGYLSTAQSGEYWSDFISFRRAATANVLSGLYPPFPVKLDGNLAGRVHRRTVTTVFVEGVSSPNSWCPASPSFCNGPSAVIKSGAPDVGA